jgi:hypothetical protein
VWQLTGLATKLRFIVFPESTGWRSTNEDKTTKNESFRGGSGSTSGARLYKKLSTALPVIDGPYRVIDLCVCVCVWQGRRRRGRIVSTRTFNQSRNSIWPEKKSEPQTEPISFDWTRDRVSFRLNPICRLDCALSILIDSVRLIEPVRKVTFKWQTSWFLSLSLLPLHDRVRLFQAQTLRDFKIPARLVLPLLLLSTSGPHSTKSNFKQKSLYSFARQL